MTIGRNIVLLKNYRGVAMGDIGVITDVVNEHSAYALFQKEDDFFVYISMDMKDIFWEFA